MSEASFYIGRLKPNELFRLDFEPIIPVLEGGSEVWEETRE